LGLWIVTGTLALPGGVALGLWIVTGVLALPGGVAITAVCRLLVCAPPTGNDQLPLAPGPMKHREVGGGPTASMFPGGTIRGAED